MERERERERESPAGSVDPWSGTTRDAGAKFRTRVSASDDPATKEKKLQKQPGQVGTDRARRTTTDTGRTDRPTDRPGPDPVLTPDYNLLSNTSH